jgi:hypothetical protein
MPTQPKASSDPKTARRAALIEDTKRRVVATNDAIEKTRTIVERTRETTRRQRRTKDGGPPGQAS